MAIVSSAAYISSRQTPFYRGSQTGCGRSDDLPKEGCSPSLSDPKGRAPSASSHCLFCDLPPLHCPVPTCGVAPAETSRSRRVQGSVLGTTLATLFSVLCRSLCRCQETPDNDLLLTHSPDTDEGPAPCQAGQDMTSPREGVPVSFTHCCPLLPRRVPGTQLMLQECLLGECSSGSRSPGSR